MSQNEEGGDGTNLERTSFPLFRPKKGKMSSKTTRDIGSLSGWGKSMEEGGTGPLEQLVDYAEDSIQEELTLRGMRRSSSGSEDGDKDSPPGAEMAGGLNPYLMNPLLMGLQLPQLAMLMQQQQPPQQQQQPSQQMQNPSSNLNLPSSSSLLNPLMIPHLLPSNQTPGVMLPLEQQQKSWMYGASASEMERPLLLDESQKGTIMGSTTNMRTMPRVMKGTKEAFTSHKEDSVSTTSGKQPFVCEICNDWFFSREKLVIHLVMNHSMQHCHFCSQLFETEDALAEHERQSHLPLECDTCKLSVPTSEELAEHYESEHDVRTCIYCGVLVKPKSYYEVHVRRKHFVCCSEALQQDVGERVRIVDRWDGQEGNSIWTFVCRLCGKERKRLETFGHFFSYHRLSLSCLIQLLESEGIVFSVQGTPAPGSSNVQNSSQQRSSESAVVDASNVDASQTSGIGEESQQHHHRRNTSSPSLTPSRCTVCTNPYSVQVPKLAHDLFCRRSTTLALCKFCDRTFNSKTSRDSHVAKEHVILPCLVTECLTDIVFTQESQLSAHYSTDHCVRVCSYCKSLVSTRDGKYLAHLKHEHACSNAGRAIRSVDANLSGSDLYHIQTYDTSVSVICSLCDADITSLMKDVISFFRHLQLHKVTLRLALTLLEIHPSCENVDVEKLNKNSTLLETQEQNATDQENNKNITWGAIPSESEELTDNSKSSRLETRSKSKLGQKSNSTKERKDAGGDGRKKGDSSESSKTKNGNPGGESSGGDGKKSHGDGTDDAPFDSSSEISSEDEDLGSDADVGENEDLTEDDDEEYTVKETKIEEKVKKNIPLPLSEMGEADIDPTEVECILTDSSDDDGDCDSFDDDNLVGLEADSDEPSAIFSSMKVKEESSGKTDKTGTGLLENVDLLERTMQELFQDENLQDVALAGNKSDQQVKIEQAKAKRKGIVCEICRGKFSTKEGPRQLLDHLNSLHGYTIAPYCTPKEFVCTVRGCREVFSTQGSLSYHLSEVHQQEQKIIDAESFKIFQCPYCALHSTSKLAMRQHVFNFHRENYVCDNPLEDLAHRCRHCSGLFWRTEDRDDHQVEAHKDKMDTFFKCYVCSHLYSSKNVHSESRRRDCSLCGKVLWSKRAHAIHYRMKHSAASKVGFRCRICQKRFDSKDESLCGKVLWSKRAHAIHYRMKHSAASKVGFRCRICQKRFDSKDERKLHYQVDHEGESPYHCAECGKGFASKSGMYGHRQLHTGSGVSKCQYCGKEFTKLKYHIRKHTGEGLINCEICSKSFTNSFALKEHRVIHNRQTQILCQQCGKGFNSEKYLQRHVAIVHEPSHTFTCPLCPKAFSQQARLKAHLMTHTGVKHIKCLLCEKAYSVRKSLRRHLLEKHEISPEHPQYKHCFYAMSAAEAGLHIPEGVPTNISGEPTEDDDSTSQSSPKEEEEEKPLAKKSPKKGTPGRKPSTSAAFEDYSSIPSGKNDVQKTKGKKSPTTKKAWSKQTESQSTPGTSGEGRHRILKKSRQKTSPRKVTKKGEVDESDLLPAGSDEENESRSSTPEVRRRGRPRKKRANSNASARVQPPKTRGSPMRKLQQQQQLNQESELLHQEQEQEFEMEIPAAAPPTATKRSPPPTPNLGTTRKKRRVEAIVETLQKSTGSPSGSSPKEDDDDEEDEEEDGEESESELAAGDDPRIEIPVVGIGATNDDYNQSSGANDDQVGSSTDFGGVVEDTTEEMNEDDFDLPVRTELESYEDDGNCSGGGFDAVPTLARITPLITRNNPKKGIHRTGDSGKRYVQNLQARTSKDGDDEYS
ncbi:hypothetical protein C0J52_07913 [Blattella germanica]|nr:hypothetical protein C0J52_07913 [Blattella germanica]